MRMSALLTLLESRGTQIGGNSGRYTWPDDPNDRQGKWVYKEKDGKEHTGRWAMQKNGDRVFVSDEKDADGNNIVLANGRTMNNIKWARKSKEKRAKEQYEAPAPSDELYRAGNDGIKHLQAASEEMDTLFGHMADASRHLSKEGKRNLSRANKDAESTRKSVQKKVNDIFAGKAARNGDVDFVNDFTTQHRAEIKTIQDTLNDPDNFTAAGKKWLAKRGKIESDF